MKAKNCFELLKNVKSSEFLNYYCPTILKILKKFNENNTSIKNWKTNYYKTITDEKSHNYLKHLIGEMIHKQ